MSLSALQLDAFHALAREGSFTRASKRLHITQSALSQRILNLEQELGTALLIRDKKKIRLTEAGEQVLQYCGVKDGLESELVSGLTGMNGTASYAGILRVAGYSSVMRSLALPALAPWISENPGVQLITLTRETVELPELLKTGEADYLILDRDLNKPDIESVYLGEERYVLVEARSFSSHRADHDVYLDHDEQDETTLRYLEHVGAKRPKLSQKPSQKLRRMFLDDIYGIREGVRLGLGRAVIPLHLIRSEREFKILNPGKAMSVPVYLHNHRQSYYPRMHDAVVDLLKAGAKAILTK